MNSKSSQEFEELLTALSEGEVGASELPLENVDFWQAVFTRAARPVRTSRSSHVAAAAASLLHRPISPKYQAVRRRAAVRALGSPDRGTRRRAIRFMHEARPARDLLEAASRAIRDPDTEVRDEAVRLLANRASRQTLAPLLDVLATSFDGRENLAAGALVQVGELAVPGLNRLLDDRDARIRWRAARCLTRIAAEQKMKTRPALIKALHDDSPSVAWVAADGLLALGPSVGVPVLRSILTKPVTPVTIRALHHYAAHAAPAKAFRPLAHATRGAGVIEAASGQGIASATLVAVGDALKALEAKV
jgi:HEAT repeat protein